MTEIAVDRDNDGNLPIATTEAYRGREHPGGAVRRKCGQGRGRKRRHGAPTGWSRRMGSYAAHVAKFDINESTGQIQIKEPLNHEDVDGCGYDDTAMTPPSARTR